MTIENVLLLDPHTLLVVNDNNFPYGGGRALASDATEFLKIRLPFSLANTTMIAITTATAAIATVAAQATTGTTTERKRGCGASAGNHSGAAPAIIEKNLRRRAFRLTHPGRMSAQRLEL